MKPRLLLYIALGLLLSGCTPAGLSGWPDKALQTFRIPTLAPDTGSLQTQIDQALQRGNYLAALDLLRAELEQGCSEQVFGDSYPRALNGLLSQADRQLKSEEYLKAGHLYRKVIDNLPKNRSLAADVEIDLPQLNNLLEQCADHLLERGLLAYRNGEFRQALKIWDKINNFHPRHTASQRAIRTTRLQLQNLEDLPAS